MRLICRVCLQTSSEFIDMESPFNCEQLTADAEITYLDCFRACTQLEIQTSDSVPQCLCFACCSELKAAYSFLLKALEAERTLQERQLTMTEEHVIEEEDDVHDDDDNDAEELDEHNEAAADEHIDAVNVKVEFFEIDVVNEAEHVEHELSNVEQNTASTELLVATENRALHNDNANDAPSQAQEQIDPTQIAINELCGSVQEPEEETETTTFLVQADDTEDEEFLSSIEDETIECGKCGHVMLSEAYDEHLETGNCGAVEPLQCSHCTLKFQSKLELVKHACAAAKTKATGMHDDEDVAEVLSCSICAKTFNHTVALNAHLKYHLRKEANLKAQACNICGKTFSSQYYRQIHQEHVHRDDRELFQCEHCAKMYFSKTALDSHMRIHTGETKECAVCNKQFVRQYELNVHMRFHTGDYPFACEVCGKRFAIKGHLRSHMWKHQGLKLQCDDCGKLFTSTKALQEHSFTHTEMPFRCSYCEKGYPSKQKYKVHLRRAHFVELDAQELEKVIGNSTPKPLQRKKRTLVQADSVMKEVEVKTKRELKEDDEWGSLIESTKIID